MTASRHTCGARAELGYLASLNPTVASLLVQKRRGSNALIFTILSDYFLSLADRLTR